MKIQIDTHEHKRLNNAKYCYESCEVEITPLTYGDYVFDEQVVFEYKTINDFMSSVSNGSVFEEAANQSQHYPYHYVIIEGDIRTFIESNWRFKKNYSRYMGMYKGAIRRLRTFTNVIECSNEGACFSEMLLQATKCLDPKVYGGTKRSVRCGDVLSHTLVGVGGVSSKRAEDIIKTLRLRTLNDLMKCSIDDFKSVKGIGAKTALNIYEWLHSRRL